MPASEEARKKDSIVHGDALGTEIWLGSLKN